MPADVKIRVLSEDKTKRELSKVDKSLALMTASIAAVTGAAVLLKKTFEFAEEGAQLELTEQRFNRLARSIGTTADALNKDLRVATGGMLSGMEQMGLATDLMSLGLAKSHEEAVRLGGIAGQLNMDMNQLVLTLTNQTTMRFDALGVAVDGFKEKVKVLEDAGHDTNEAFKLAFMEQAEDQIEKVGSAVDSTAGSFKRLRAKMKDASDEFKAWLAQTADPVINSYLDQSDAVAMLNDMVKRGIITDQEWYLLRNDLTAGLIEGADVLKMMLPIQEAYRENLKRINPELRMHNSLLGKSSGLIPEVKEATSWLDVATRIHTEGLTLANLAAWEQVTALEAQKVAIDALAGGLEALAPHLQMGYGWEGHVPGAGGGGGGGGGWSIDALGRQYRRTPGGGYELGPNYGDFATGGSFRVGGFGGSDTTPVSFMATPGETVSVGGGTSDMENVLSEIQRLVDTLPLAIADAVERR